MKITFISSTSSMLIQGSDECRKIVRELAICDDDDIQHVVVVVILCLPYVLRFHDARIM